MVMVSAGCALLRCTYSAVITPFKGAIIRVPCDGSANRRATAFQVRVLGVVKDILDLATITILR